MSVLQCYHGAGSVWNTNFCGIMRIFAIIFLCVRLNTAQRADGDTLQLAQVLFRHGARAPIDYFNFPSDPPELRKPFPVELGEMTNHGIDQLFTLGLNLKETYGEFMHNTYVPSQLKVFAGDDNRTVVSASAVLAALFPPNEAQCWSSQLKWQPIPVHTTQILDEVNFGVLDTCEALAAEVYSSQLLKDANSANSDLIKFLEQKTGFSIPNIIVLDRVLDTLNIRVRNGLPDLLPLQYWARNQTFMDLVKMKSAEVNAIIGDIPGVKRATQGWFMNQLIMNMENRIQKLTNHKLVLYSAHDANIMVLAKSLDLQEIQHKLAGFGAYIAIELHQRMGAYFIEIWYHPQLNQTRTLVSIPKCGSPCSLQVFKTLVPLVSNAEFDAICHGPPITPLPNAMPGEEHQQTWITILGLLCAALSALLLCTCCCLCQARQRLKKLDSEQRSLLDGHHSVNYITS